MKINAIQCPKCGDLIFSRANHDFRSCTCGDTSVDGGFSSYGGRILYKPENKFPKMIEIEVKATKRELYDDWNHRKNKYGLIKGSNKNFKC